MTEKRNITRDDIYLKARISAEGVRTGKGYTGKTKDDAALVLEGCELPVMVFPNPFSSLEIAYEGNKATITDMGEVIGTGIRGRGHMPFVSMHLNYGCHNQTMGLTCKYCTKGWPRPDVDLAGQEVWEETAAWIDWAISAVQQGWRGPILFSQGVLPPDRRHEITGLIEKAMSRFRESLDDDVFKALQFAPNVYPADDFKEMETWKSFGVNSVLMDLEVMDPAYWTAICPGKSLTYTHEYWKEAQEAAAEIFGRGRGSVSSMVMGIEPMAAFVEGVEERISKGVYTIAYAFLPISHSQYGGFRPPTADWFVEATEKIVDSYVRYADTLDVNLLEDDRPGFTRRGRSVGDILIEDEMTRRLQEMAKLPAGLPKPGFIGRPDRTLFKKAMGETEDFSRVG